MATLKWTLAALKSTLMALRLRVDAEVASILGEPEVGLWRRSMRGFQSLALRSSTSARRPPTRRVQVLATSARPRILARSARIARPTMEAAAKVAQCAESDRAPSREGIGEMHTYFYFLSFVGTRPAIQRRAAVKLCYRPAGAAELEPSTATPAAALPGRPRVQR